jgi:hypothetical protein
MMTWPADAPATNEGITWREARYLARVVQMLVTSPNDRDEFRRELEHLLRAAEALRAASARGDRRAEPAQVYDLAKREAETAAEGAVVELWRSNGCSDYGKLQAAGTVSQLRRSAPAGPDPVDEGELARAVDEIERAAAVLRAEERRPAQVPPPVRAEAPDRMPPMKQQMMEFWLPVAAATVGMLAAIVSFVR